MLLQRHIEPLERFLFVPRRSSRLVAGAVRPALGR